MKHRLVGLSVALALALAAFRLGCMAVAPVFEPSEARYATLAANMARTGDFLVPRLTYNGEYVSFDGKPPLVFQAGGVACRLLGVSPFAVRLFPFFCALLLLAILYRTTAELDGRATAQRATFLCATSCAFYAMSGFCMTDMSLACAVAGSLLLYRRHLAAPRLRYVLAIGLLLGCGMVVKGPVALALFGGGVLLDAALNRHWKALLDVRWLAALALFLLVAAPWFVLMSRYNPGFLKYFFINENLLRFLVHHYGDKYGSGRETFRGMALVWLFVTTLPGSLVPLVAFLRHPRIPSFKALRGDFAFLSAGAITLFWCLTSRVPIPYLLPAVPLAVLVMARHFPARLPFRRWAPAFACLAMAILGLALAVTWFVSDRMPGAAARQKTSPGDFSYEFYHGPWGKGHP